MDEPNIGGINMGNLKPNQSPSPEKNIYIFFSFDMVGSTKFKTKNESWPFEISVFYYTVCEQLHCKIPKIKVWKYLGDEILLYVSIRDFDSPSEIYEIPKMVYGIQNDVAKKFQKYSSSPELNVKSTVWIAGIQTIDWEASLSDKNYKNIRIPIKKPGEKKLEEDKLEEVKTEELPWDFLGPDMDIGFRVAKFAFHHKVVLSADFAYFLYSTKPKNCEIDDDLKIVSYEILKGVWNEQYYPIVWYYPYWDTAPYDFFYADHKKNDIVERVLSERIDDICKLEEVYDELGKTEEINEFVKECKKLLA